MRTIFITLFALVNLIVNGQALIVGSISSSQSVCTSCQPAILIAIPPANGTLPVYQWQSSLDNSAFSNIDGATTINYQPGYLTTTMYYKQLQNATGTTGGPLPTNIVALTVTQMQLVKILQGLTITNTRCYNASDTMFVAGNSTEFIVHTGGYVTMISGQSIKIYPGAKFDSTSYLHAYIRTSIKAVNRVLQATVQKVNSIPMTAIRKVNGVSNF